jgi:hypothetical protein
MWEKAKPPSGSTIGGFVIKKFLEWKLVIVPVLCHF